MRRLVLLLLLAVAIIGGQTIINCSQPLGPNGDNPNTNPNQTDTVYVYDTTYLHDTLFTIDTVFTGDTSYVYDTIFVGDTVIVIDTIINGDTVFIYDTIPADTQIVIDTIIVGDTVIYVDTLFTTDTVILVDTITLIDTLTDTVIVPDTVLVIDTLVVSPTYCANLSSCDKKILWLLQNHAGQYRLSFEASGDTSDPKSKLMVEVDGVQHTWLPYANPELVIETDLYSDARVLIYSSTPHAFGHGVHICLTVDKL